ncbi:flavodoxin [Methanobrevibacter sp. 87.7]|uniref:flavodoxin family protein n=1 Tax=Methanobrevibacter sp. 87.7 TaxID=387957 RepID=UPI000B5068E2|nr:flavodoxin [Methanobrevibacter sp. 87.7]OWT32771.1 flavodoxin [Methanobrevibacter sp. 87.7]
MKALIIYYSQDDSTRIVAETLSNKLNTDIVEIKDKKPRKGFKNRLTSSFDAIREVKTEIIPNNVDVSNYDVIYFGTPVWSKKPSPAIITIIDKCDLRGKDIVIFATMSKSGGTATLDRMEEKIKARGGRVIERFTIKTKGKSKSYLKKYSEAYAKMLDLSLYH